MFRYAKNVRLASFRLLLALSGSHWLSVTPTLALTGSHLHSLAYSGPLWLSNFAYTSLDRLTGRQGTSSQYQYCYLDLVI